MDVERSIQESQAELLLEPLGFQTQAGKESFRKQLRLISSNEGILRRRQQSILHMREQGKVLESTFEEIKTLEPLIDTFFHKTDVEKNSYEQLFFSWKPLSVLNTIPFSLLLLSYFKLYMVPIMALLMPLAMLILPYFYLVHWYNLPITVEQYIEIAMSMFGLQQFSFQNPKVMVQATITIFSIAQSIYQPIQNALHLGKIHANLMEKGEAVSRLLQLTKQMFEVIPESQRPTLDLFLAQDTHQQFVEAWESPYQLRLLLQMIGDMEVIYRLSQNTTLQPVHFITSKPCLQIKDGVDPFLENPIPYTLEFTQHTHAILTGPNRGGKSSVLRSTLLNVVMAQTFGFSFTHGFMKLRPFDWIATGLKLEDRPGAKSMFESEVEFATQILQLSKQSDKVGFVLFDELFHSTNPPDGARTANIFLQKLWKQANVVSFISTHVFDLAKKAHKGIQKLCVPAHKGEDGDLRFSYTLQEGICEVSSVDLILQEKGLLVRKV
jgi:hypothetical protein